MRKLKGNGLLEKWMMKVNETRKSTESKVPPRGHKRVHSAPKLKL